MKTMSTPHFPACYVQLPPSASNRRAAFYLAAEEFIAQNFQLGSYLFSWQLSPTVVMGRNQIAHQEVDMDFCAQNHIDIIRRKSGGGAIFADGNNIMWSLITQSGPVEPLFAEYAACVAEALRKLGADVEVSGRNDIVLRGKGKVCGNAFYHTSRSNIVHGTMLYDTNPELMQGALHPNVDKLQAKGVQSVRSRVALLKDSLSMGVRELRTRLRQLLCDKEVSLSPDDIRHIEKIEQNYYEPAYFYGTATGNGTMYERRIEGCGTLGLRFNTQGSLIKSVELTGDFFELANARQAFDHAFSGIPLTRLHLLEAIRTHHPEQSIRHLTTGQLMELLELDSPASGSS